MRGGTFVKYTIAIFGTVGSLLAIGTALYFVPDLFPNCPKWIRDYKQAVERKLLSTVFTTFKKAEIEEYCKPGLTYTSKGEAKGGGFIYDTKVLGEEEITVEETTEANGQLMSKNVTYKMCCSEVVWKMVGQDGTTILFPKMKGCNFGDGKVSVTFQEENGRYVKIKESYLDEKGRRCDKDYLRGELVQIYCDNKLVYKNPQIGDLEYLFGQFNPNIPREKLKEFEKEFNRNMETLQKFGEALEKLHQQLPYK